MVRLGFFKDAFEGQELPDEVRACSEEICTTYGINGISDPMYIANIVGLELGFGDGQGSFQKIRPDTGSIKRLSERLAGAYGSNIDGAEQLEGIISRYF